MQPYRPNIPLGKNGQPALGLAQYRDNGEAEGLLGSQDTLQNVGQAARLVDCKASRPFSWLIQLEASTPPGAPSTGVARFAITAGVGHTAQIFSVRASGRTELQVAARNLTVDAFCETGAVQVVATVSQNGQSRFSTPTTATGQSLSAPAATLTTIPSSGRCATWLANIGANPVNILVAGQVFDILVAGAVLRLDFGGEIQFFSLLGTTVSVAELYL